MNEHDSGPLLLTLGLHAHQPEGNFGHVFQDHLRDVYEPFLRRAAEGDLLPLTLHLSGPLLDWLEGNASGYLDLIGELTGAGKLELLLAGYYEPILPSLPREDRIEQILWMKDALRHRFGVDATGLWLTERVWEPALAADLAEAGVKYVLVDDRHFVASGFPRESLHAPFRTEASGKSLGVFAIDEQLRYMIPFHPPEDTATYLRDLRSKGHRLAVAADDIEKFGGWPGTREWVYEKGWLDDFMRVMRGLEEEGQVKLATFSEALEEVQSGGLAYLPSASYREMEEWSLPTEAYRRIPALRAALGPERFDRGDSPLVRGSHWRNFLVKYPEANRMHKKMMVLSGLCRARGNPEGPRRSLGKAQCNDAYWHGVFGGLYLRHLRDTIWRNLAEAERELRGGETLGWEDRDLDMDGHDEIWVHSSEFSALVSPYRGGSIEELTLFHQAINLANTLTRRREAYHERESSGEEPAHHPTQEGADTDQNTDTGTNGADGGTDGTPSIHDLEEGLAFTEPPPTDLNDRALFLERVLSGGTLREDYEKGEYHPIHSWADKPFSVERVMGIARENRVADDGERGPEGETHGMDSHPPEADLLISLSAPEPGSLRKTMYFSSNGVVELHFAWDPSAFTPDASFTSEVSLGAEAEIKTIPEAEEWRHPIATFSKSEKGFDETVQGESVLLRWPVGLGAARVTIRGAT